MRLRLGIAMCACLLAIAGTAAGFTFNDPALDAAVRGATGYSGPPTGDIAPADVAGITTLDASHQGIADLSGIQNLTNLNVLGLGFNNITSVALLTGLTNLVSLDLGFGSPLDADFDIMNSTANQITDVSPLATLINLQYLNLGGNAGITDINILGNMDSLAALILGYSTIADFTPLNDVATQLSMFFSVSTGMTDTDVDQIVSTMVNLQVMGLTQISDISSLTGLTSLAGVLLGGCTISDYSVMAQWSSLAQLALLYCPLLTSLDVLNGLNLPIVS